MQVNVKQVNPEQNSHIRICQLHKNKQDNIYEEDVTPIIKMMHSTEEGTGTNSEVNNERIDAVTKCLNTFTVYPVHHISCSDFQKCIEMGYELIDLNMDEEDPDFMELEEVTNGKCASELNHVFNITLN